MTTRRVTSALFALLVAFLLVVQGADAAKPGSTAPTTLVTTDAYEATELFDTADLLAAINADLGGGTLDEVALLGGSNGLAYGAGGVLVLEFEALDSSDLTTFADGTQDLSEVVSGVALYADDGTLTASVHRGGPQPISAGRRNGHRSNFPLTDSAAGSPCRVDHDFISPIHRPGPEKSLTSAMSR